MSAFIFGCLALLLFAGLFLLFPRRRAGDREDMARANLAWFRLRQRELAAEGADELAEDVRLRLLEDESVPQPAAPAQVAGRFPAWALWLAIALFSVGVYLQLGSMRDVLISEQLSALDQGSSAAEMQALMHTIEQRSKQRPDNLHYTALLARYYMGQQDYSRAADTYDALAAAAPEDAQALAYAAQARYLATGRLLSDAARVRAEQALAINPHQRTALGLLGMASYEQGQYRAAIDYWQRLVAMEPPGSETRQMIAGVIASAREKLAEPATAASDPDPAAAGVTVTVSLPAGARIDPADTVFVLARNAESDSRMPIAVQRLRGADLPLTLRLDDSHSMAGQKLSATPSVVVVVQVSPGGRPGEANASWLGRAGPLAPGGSEQAVAITLAAAGS